MESDVLENYRKAGRILAKVCREARTKVDVDVPLIEVAEFVEGSIRKEGAEPAFPCNISRDRVAAHYTPGPKDESTFGESMTKLDIGVHVDGYIADAAITVDLGGHPELVEASQAALDAAIELVTPGANTADIGAAIERAINWLWLQTGFQPHRAWPREVLGPRRANHTQQSPGKGSDTKGRRRNRNRAFCHEWLRKNFRGVSNRDFRFFRPQAD